MAQIVLIKERAVESLLDTKEAVTPVDLTGFTPSALREVAERYHKYGFALFDNAEPLTTDEKIIRVAEELKLGTTHVTEYNREKFSHLFQDNKLNTITSTRNSEHIVFDNTNAQGFHSDGTFEPIGKVKTSILFCEQNAREGGDTILFDSVNAFRLLYEYNREWAEALLHPESLRRASIYNDGAEYIDAVFKILPDGEIISRFTIDSSSDWEYGFERVKHLEKAFGYFNALTQKDSGFSTQFVLQVNQGIIFANDKIAHGRTAFDDDASAPRKMIRGLYLNRPVA